MLHSFAGYISCDGCAFSFSGDFVNLINVDNAFFSPLDVIVRRMDQLQKHVFDIFTDITGFCQCRGVSNCERNTQNLCQRPRDVGLAGTGGTDHQDIALLNINI